MPNDTFAEPRWVDLESLSRINALVVASTGEPLGLRDPGLLESAWGKPFDWWAHQGEEDVSALAVSLMAGGAQNHPFVQGDTRTAFEAGVLFLNLNGWGSDSDLDARALADDSSGLIEHRIDEAASATLLRPNVRPRR